jgi:amino acid permease
MQCLGEMTTWLPVPGVLPNFASRYVDQALGFAVGWNVSDRCSFCCFNILLTMMDII